MSAEHLPPLAPASAPGSPVQGWTYPPTILGRIGLALCALAGAVLCFSASGTVVRAAGGLPRYELKNDVIAYGIIALAVLGFCAAAPWVWARLVGVTVGAFFTGFIALALIGARTSKDFLKGTEVELGSAGVIMVISFLIGAIGVALALVGFRRPAPMTDPALAPEVAGTSGKAIASMVLGLVGLLLAPAGALAVGLALLARDDIRLSGGRLGGAGFAIAGLVLGILDLVGWGLGLGIGMAVAKP